MHGHAEQLSFPLRADNAMLGIDTYFNGRQVNSGSCASCKCIEISCPDSPNHTNESQLAEQSITDMWLCVLYLFLEVYTPVIGYWETGFNVKTILLGTPSTRKSSLSI